MKKRYRMTKTLVDLIVFSFSFFKPKGENSLNFIKKYRERQNFNSSKTTKNLKILQKLKKIFKSSFRIEFKYIFSNVYIIIL